MRAELAVVTNTGEHVIWIESPDGYKMLYARFKANELEEAKKELELIKSKTKENSK